LGECTQHEKAADPKICGQKKKKRSKLVLFGFNRTPPNESMRATIKAAAVSVFAFRLADCVRLALRLVTVETAPSSRRALIRSVELGANFNEVSFHAEKLYFFFSGWMSEGTSDPDEGITARVEEMRRCGFVCDAGMLLAVDQDLLRAIFIPEKAEGLKRKGNGVVQVLRR
jgi:hypothetical protein